MGTIKEIFSLLLSLAGIVAVLFVTYYGTRWITARADKMSQSKYMNVVDRIMLGQNKYLAIVEISGRYYLLSVADSNISIIKELDALALNENNRGTGTEESFAGVFSKIIGNLKNNSGSADKTERRQ